MNTKTTPPAAPADDLATLAGQAQQLQDESQASAEPLGQGAAPPIDAGPSNGQIAADVFRMMRDLGCAIFGVQSPRLAASDSDLDQIGEAWGAVADKRGWDFKKFMGDYALEVSAGMMTLAVVRRVSHAVTVELAAREPKPEPAPAPQAEVVG